MRKPSYQWSGIQVLDDRDAERFHVFTGLPGPISITKPLRDLQTAFSNKSFGPFKFSKDPKLL